MKLKIVIYIFIASAMLLTACQKDIDIFIPDAGQATSADTNWVSSIQSSMPISKLKNELIITPYIDSFNNNGAAPVAVSPSGMRCNFLPNSFVNNNGVVVTGNVQAEMILIKKKGDLIRLDKPTQSNGRMLVSGGVVYLKVKQNGDALSLTQSAGVSIKFSDGTPNPNMKYFLGDVSNPDQFNWVLPTDSQSNRVLSANLDYQIYTNHLNWINCDYFYDTTGINRVAVATELPNNYTNANTEVFLVFKEIRSVLGMYGTPSTKKFSTQKIPTGKPAYVVALSKQGNDYFFAHELITTDIAGTSVSTQNVPLTPKKSSLLEIKTWLDSL